MERQGATIGRAARARRRAALAALLLLALAALLARPAPGSPDAAVIDRNAPLAALDGFLGDWEIDAEWENGEPIWSRNEFRAGLGGAIVEIRTYTRDADGSPFERYFTVFSRNPETGNLQSHAFTFDGMVSVIDDVQVEESDAGTALTSVWRSGQDEFRQVIRTDGGETYGWTVWARGPRQDAWSLLIDGTWQRASARD